jgi:hypothetical protein
LKFVFFKQNLIQYLGKFFVHKDCCARVNGDRQTFLLHQSLPDDTLFDQLPSAVKGRPALDIVGGLDVEGELMASFRGKELVFAIGKV